MQLIICLDGLSKGIHGNTDRRHMDHMIRERLEEEGSDVIEIASADLDDPEAMKCHMKRISQTIGFNDRFLNIGDTACAVGQFDPSFRSFSPGIVNPRVNMRVCICEFSDFPGQ